MTEEVYEQPTIQNEGGKYIVCHKSLKTPKKFNSFNQAFYFSQKIVLKGGR